MHVKLIQYVENTYASTMVHSRTIQVVGVTLGGLGTGTGVLHGNRHRVSQECMVELGLCMHASGVWEHVCAKVEVCQVSGL